MHQDEETVGKHHSKTMKEAGREKPRETNRKERLSGRVGEGEAGREGSASTFCNETITKRWIEILGKDID